MQSDRGQGEEQFDTIMSLLKMADPDHETEESREATLRTTDVVYGSKDIYASFVALCGDCVVMYPSLKVV